MTKLSKILRIVAAAAFLTALAVNVKVTLTDPFVGMSQEALADTTTNNSGTTGTLPVECYDKYDAYASGWHKLKRFRACDQPACAHIWAYNPKKRTLCQNK